MLKLFVCTKKEGKERESGELSKIVFKEMGSGWKTILDWLMKQSFLFLNSSSFRDILIVLKDFAKDWKSFS